VAAHVTRKTGERLPMFVLAAVLLAGAIGSAFAAGFVIGRILV
jgi:hypothetical protein